jgi:hypothetical protein
MRWVVSEVNEGMRTASLPKSPSASQPLPTLYIKVVGLCNSEPEIYNAASGSRLPRLGPLGISASK